MSNKLNNKELADLIALKAQISEMETVLSNCNLKTGRTNHEQ